jgi:hypothetical protein
MSLEVFVEGNPEDVLEMVPLEDHIQKVVVLDVLDPVWVYTFICVEIKTVHQNSRASYVPEGADDAGGTVPIF